jgi:hypothetical protein
MKLLILRWNEAIEHHGKKLKDVAADIADQIAADPELRNEAAAIVTMFFLQPGLDAHADAYKEDTGQHLGDSIHKIIPNRSRP